MKRRSFLKLLGLTSLVPPFSPASVRDAGPAVFAHGLASGDPAADSVLLWTRVTPADPAAAVECHWQVAEDIAFHKLVAQGRIVTGPERDFTVKTVAGGLKPDTAYHYRFTCLGAKSGIGRTRTLPVGAVAGLRLAIVSCANHPAGHFNVYRAIAEDRTVSAVIHLGDYIYEYGTGGYASENAEALGRAPIPPHALSTLADYRARHAQYKSDPDLQALHAAHPMMAIWDDHEVKNNSWSGGAEGLDEDPEHWRAQRNAALRAYREWMPVRDNADGSTDRIYRSFTFGDLASLILVDTRHYARDKQISYQDFAEGDEARAYALSAAPGRGLLGQEQEDWLRSTLEASARTRWQLVGQQVMVTDFPVPAGLGDILIPGAKTRLPLKALARHIAMSGKGLPITLDSWSGYRDARRRFIDMLARAPNPVVLSGDIHSATAAKLGSEQGRTEVVELVTPSVTSPGLEQYYPAVPGVLEKAMLAANPDFMFFDGAHHGWIDLRLTHERCTANWRVVETIATRDHRARLIRRLSIAPKQPNHGYRDIALQRFSLGWR